MTEASLHSIFSQFGQVIDANIKDQIVSKVFLNSFVDRKSNPDVIVVENRVVQEGMRLCTSQHHQLEGQQHMQQHITSALEQKSLECTTDAS